MGYLRIADWPADERPREKLVRLGESTLSDAELLAIILRVGGRSESALDLARRLLREHGGFRGLAGVDFAELMRSKGIGRAKAAQIKASLAIADRLSGLARSKQRRITCSRDAYEAVHLRYRDRKREHFAVLLLTSRARLISEKVLFQGSISESMVSPREVIREIINAAAAQVIFVHNHPSGEVSPSREDIRVTRLLQAACRTIEVNVLDHLIIGADGFYSFADAGDL